MWSSNLGCFNPYFNGYSTLTQREQKFCKYSFNPCFNGYSTLTVSERSQMIKNKKVVSILVLMDTLL